MFTEEGDSVYATVNKVVAGILVKQMEEMQQKLSFQMVNILVNVIDPG